MRSVTLDEYQKQALQFAFYPNMGENLPYATLGLCGETGETAEKLLLALLALVVSTGKVAEKVKKRERDSGSVFTPEARLAYLKELSDVLWYIADSAMEAGSSLEEVAEIGLEKLRARAAKGTLGGSGDNR